MELKDMNEIFGDELVDPIFAAGYVNVSLEEDGVDGLLYGLQKVSRAHGMTKVAELSQVNRETLYRSLSPTGNPGIRPLIQLVTALGLRLGILPSTIKHLDLANSVYNGAPLSADAPIEDSPARVTAELQQLASELREQIDALSEMQADVRKAQCAQDLVHAPDLAAR